MPMMQVTRSLSALDERPLRRSTDKDNVNDNVPKPFFIMDWLEDLTGNQDLEKIARLLKTPTKQQPRDMDIEQRDEHCGTFLPSDPTTPKSSNRKKVLGGSTSCPALHTFGPSRLRSQSNSPVRPRQLLFGVFAAAKPNEDTNTNTNISDQSETQSQSVPVVLRQRPRRPRSPHSIYRKSIAMGNAWNAKGLAKAQQGLWADALGCWDNALEVRVHLLGRNHLDVANTYNNRGIALGKVGRTVEALEALQNALEIRWHLWEHSSDKSYDPILSTLHNMANVHQQAGDLQQALQVFGQARDLGRLHPNNIPMARICVAMGHVYYEAEQWIDARDAYLDAVQLYRIERRLLQQQLKQTIDDDILTAAILTCQQELADVERDVDELDRRLPILHKLVLPPVHRSFQQ